MEFFHKTNIDFVGFRYKCFMISGVIIVAGLVSLAIRGGPRLGVDFKGGTLVQVRFNQEVPIQDVRASMARAGYGKAEIVTYGSAQEYIIKLEQVSEADLAAQSLTDALKLAEPGRTWRIVMKREIPPDISKGFDGASLVTAESDTIPEINGLISNLKGQGLPIIEATREGPTRATFRLPFMGAEARAGENIKAELAKDLPGKEIEIRRTETVGPKIGRELSRKAWAAMIVSLFGIMIYVGWRFEFKFAVGAVASLAHDVLVTVGLFSIFNREISLFVVAALLTIVGYSINDTIVVYDRIRENFGLRRRESYETMLNISVNETLSRTIITVLTVFIVTMFLLFMGGQFVRDFALAMTIGLVTGTYSSIYVASATVVEWNNRITMRRKATRVAA
jgi:preprotein translocase subunit SecF